MAAQVLLQKAKAEPLSDLSMLDVFKWLKQVVAGRRRPVAGWSLLAQRGATGW